MDNKLNIAALRQVATEMRKLTIQTIGNFGVGHIGGASSIVETLTAIYFSEANVDPCNPRWADRDRVILSKGHAGPALYSALAMKGYFDKSLLDTLNVGGTVLPSHCDMNKTVGVDMTAGSLGQGFSAAVGMAIAGKIDKKDYKVFSIVGDGESQEGQIWEAAMLAGSKKLDNLIAFLDSNKMQIDGTTEEINSVEPLDAKWRAFNFEVMIVDGHDLEAILGAIKTAKSIKGKPSMIILNTIKGKGISFCEGTVGSHSCSFTEESWKKEVEGQKC